MPAAYYIDTDRGVVFIRGWGVLTDRDVTVVGQAIREDPRFRPQYTRLENLVGVTDFQLTAELVQWAADRQRTDPPPRRAFVVGSDLGFGMIRMLQLFADAAPTTFLTTRDPAEGFRWVGLESTAAWPDDRLFRTSDQVAASEGPSVRE